MWPFDRNDCNHRYKKVGGGLSIQRDDDGTVVCKLLRCADCGETAVFDHNDELEWRYK